MGALVILSFVLWAYSGNSLWAIAAFVVIAVAVLMEAKQ
jgi:hypothetical protein